MTPGYTAFVRVSLITALLMIVGWIAVICSSLFLRGGHPPLAAIVGIGVVMASWFLGTVGVVAGLVGVVRARTGRRKLAIVALSANAGLLAFSVLVIFM